MVRLGTGRQELESVFGHTEGEPDGHTDVEVEIVI